MNSKGFTIIELLIVVVIVFIIGLLVVTTVGSLRGDGKQHYIITVGEETFWTDSYEEKDGCIFFQTKFIHQNIKQCGFYSVRSWTK